MPGHQFGQPLGVRGSGLDDLEAEMKRVLDTPARVIKDDASANGRGCQRPIRDYPQDVRERSGRGEAAANARFPEVGERVRVYARARKMAS